MCIIIDTNCFGRVFDRSNKDHLLFSPVLDWILNGKGVAIYGGSKYNRELIKAGKFIKIFRLLKEVNKAKMGNKENIDEIEIKLIKKVNDEKFNDPHLMAIVIDTKCKLICSGDSKSLKFMKVNKLFPSHIKPPKYYMSDKNVDLLCDKYIPDDFKPTIKCNKKTREKLNETLARIG